jgi:inosine-uridine nucleoside N-ribohydrolase
MKQKIIIDTDSGMDDIIAIAMIISSKKFDIVGMTTIRGLATPIVGKKNLTKILNFINSKIEIVSGSKLPLDKKRLNCSFPTIDKINSSKLLCLNDLLVQTKTQNQNYSASEFLFQKVKSDKDKITILCLGPLTNIAKAIQKYKQEFSQKIGKIMIMGGAVFTLGNVPPSRKAEYNIFLDPEAADIIFSSGIPIILVSIDATKFVPAREELKDRIESVETKEKCGKIIKNIILANKNDFNYFYDPLAAGILIDPEIALETITTGIEISKNPSSIGQTCTTQKNINVNVVTKVDTQKFINLLFKTIK